MHTFLKISLLTLVLCAPARTLAAEIYFDPQDSSAGIGTEFVIAINATVAIDEPINAFDVAVRIPPSFTPIDTSDGNSVVSLWLERPTFDETTRLLRFSGIVPNGYAGVGGRLITMTVIPNNAEAVAVVTVDTTTRLYTDAAVPVPVTTGSIEIPIVPSKQNIPVSILDRDPPELFAVEIVRDAALYDGQSVLIFSTVDKGSGMAQYQIRKQWLHLVWGDWRDAISPFPVGASWFVTRYEVAAYDKVGNRQVAAVEGQSSIYGVVGISLSLVIVLMLLLRYIWRRTYDNASN